MKILHTQIFEVAALLPIPALTCDQVPSLLVAVTFIPLMMCGAVIIMRWYYNRLAKT